MGISNPTAVRLPEEPRMAEPKPEAMSTLGATVHSAIVAAGTVVGEPDAIHTVQTEIIELKPNTVAKFELSQFASRRLHIIDGNKKPVAALMQNPKSEYKGNNYILSNGKPHDPIFSYTLTFANGRKLLLYCPIVYVVKGAELKIFIDHEGNVQISALRALNYFFGASVDKNSFATGKVSATKENPPITLDKSPTGLDHEISDDRIVMSTKRGFPRKMVNEDAIGCARKPNGLRMVVVDGMGGHLFPEQAAGMVTESMLRAGDLLLDAVKTARDDLIFFGSLINVERKPNAAMAAIDVSGDDLEIVSKGDVSVYVIDGDGKIIHATKQDNLAYELREKFNLGGWDAVFAWLRSEAPQKFESYDDAYIKLWVKENYMRLLSDITGTVLDDSEAHYKKMKLSKGCRVVLVSDGAALSPDQIAQAVTGCSAEEGLNNIHARIDELKRLDCYCVTIGDVMIQIPFPHDDVSVGVYVHA